MALKESEIRPQELFNRYLELVRRDVAHYFNDTRAFVRVDCPACGSARQSPGLEKDGFAYVLCDECGTLYASPRPTAEQLDAFYRDAESVKFWSTHFYKETAGARREKMFRPRAQLVDEWLSRRGRERAPVFVDIGSGYGIFLEEIRRLGKFQSVTGIEPNPEMAKLCRQLGFPIVQKPVERVEEAEVQADFATAFEVLEHVFEPLQFLKSARRLLKPEGLLLFTTLTVSGFDIQVLWQNSKSVYPPHHINFISVEGMERLVARAGLQLVELCTPGQLDVDIVANRLGEDPTLPMPRFVASLLNSRLETTRRDFQDFLSAHRLSSHLRVVATLLPNH